MTVQYVLREDAAAFERADERLTSEIEEAEAHIVELRRNRDEVRLHRAEVLAAAQFLDSARFEVERDSAGVVTVSVDPKIAASTEPETE
jgi:hypothetical protein